MQERSKRMQRVERELLETLSHHLIHHMVLPGYASISAVEVSPDLRNAKVFFRLVGQSETVDHCKAALSSARADFQKYVARELQIKFCPVLRFEYGVAPKLDEVDELIENLRRPRRMVD